MYRIRYPAEDGRIIADTQFEFRDGHDTSLLVHRLVKHVDSFNCHEYIGAVFFDVYKSPAAQPSVQEISIPHLPRISSFYLDVHPPPNASDRAARRTIHSHNRDRHVNWRLYALDTSWFVKNRLQQHNGIPQQFPRQDRRKKFIH